MTCPKTVALAVGKGFDCVGTLESGDSFVIPVKQNDDKGSTTWDIPNAKGLLNLYQLGSLFQQTIRQEEQSLTVDCSKGYRSVKPGDRFECKVAKSPDQTAKFQKPAGTVGNAGVKKAIDPKQPESIIVTIDSQNNVNWQQVLPAAAAKVASTKLSAPTPQPTPTIAAQDRAKLSPEVVQKLDQIGGGDNE